MKVAASVVYLVEERTSLSSDYVWCTPFEEIAIKWRNQLRLKEKRDFVIQVWEWNGRNREKEHLLALK